MDKVLVGEKDWWLRDQNPDLEGMEVFASCDWIAIRWTSRSVVNRKRGEGKM